MPHSPLQPAPSTSASRPPGPRAWLRAAVRDPVMWVGAAVWLLSLLPSLAPVLSPDAAFTWADEFNDVPILLFVLVVLAVDLRRAEEGREKVFWGLLLGCPAGWLVARFLYVVVPWEGSGVLSDQVTDLSYLVGYLCVVLALEFRPGGADGAGLRGHRVEWLGTLLYGFFLLSYFTLAPSIFRPELYATWVPSMLLFAVIDLYLLGRVWRLLRAGLDPAWAATFRWLWWLFVAWLAGDLVEGLMYMGAIPYVDSGTPADVLWIAPGLLLLAVARSRTWHLETAAHAR